MRLVPALVLLLLAMPLAAAQAPPPACGPLTAAATAPQAALAPGDTTDVTLAVTNGGNIPAQVTATISPPPAGWTVNEPSQTQAVEPGATGSFTFAISASASATGDYAVTLNAEGVCALQGVGLPCPGGACTASAAAVGVTVPLAAPEGPSFDFGVPVEYLVAGVVLVGVASAIPLLLRRKRHGFAADCPEPLKLVRPGRGTSFPIEIRNASPEPMTARLDVGPVPEGWTAFMPLPEVQLAPREARSLWLMVRSPPEARQGEAADVELRLVDAARADSTATVRVRAEVDPAAAEGPPRA